MKMQKKKSTYILAEMASSHEGKQKLAKFIIKSAAKAKADGILLQIFNLKTYIIPSDVDYQEAQNISLDQKLWAGFITKANSLGLNVWANVYDLESIRFCKNKKIRGYKLHSSNLENEDLIKELAKEKKEILLSIGGLEKQEIKRALKIIYSVNKKPKIYLMYGLQNFPTRPEGVNLNFIIKLANEFGLPWGYQDHSEPISSASIYLPMLAIAKGAAIIEKHLTHDRSLKGEDYESALNPDEFINFVRDIWLVDGLLNKKTSEFSADELKYRQYKSLMKVVAKEYIKKGVIFSSKNLAIMRARQGGVGGRNLKLLYSRKSKFDYKKFEPIKRNELFKN